MTVSAIVTTLNEEKHIARCLNSVFNQTVKPNEVIVIDAGSRDRTVEVAEQYPVDIISVDFHSVYRSKRLGILAAANNIVLCLDGDSYIAPDFVQRGLNLLGRGYNLVTGYVYPTNPNPLSNFIAVLYRHWPPMLSGPAYMVQKQAYLELCQIKYMDGLADRCELSKEVPLQDFNNRIKCPNLVIYTELPSTVQKQMIGLGLGGGGLFLLATI